MATLWLPVTWKVKPQLNLINTFYLNANAFLMFLEIISRRPPSRNDCDGQRIAQQLFVSFHRFLFFENLIELKLTIKHVFHCKSKYTHKKIFCKSRLRCAENVFQKKKQWSKKSWNEAWMEMQSATFWPKTWIRWTSRTKRLLNSVEVKHSFTTSRDDVKFKILLLKFCFSRTKHDRDHQNVINGFNGNLMIDATIFTQR